MYVFRRKSSEYLLMFVPYQISFFYCGYMMQDKCMKTAKITQLYLNWVAVIG